MKSLGIDELDVADQLALVEEIWENIARHPDRLPLTEAQRQELDRRLARHDTHPEEVVPWDQAKAEAQNRLKR